MKLLRFAALIKNSSHSTFIFTIGSAMALLLKYYFDHAVILELFISLSSGLCAVLHLKCF